jgi:hypothetical protein
LKELTAQEARELGKRAFGKKTRKVIMKEIKKLALLHYSYATIYKSNYLCWEQIVEWLSGLGYECVVGKYIITVHWE